MYTFRDAAQRLAAREEMSYFLARYEWSWYCHLTFATPAPARVAERKFHDWIHTINRRNFGRSYYKRRVSAYWVRAMEYQINTVAHFHALVGGVSIDPTRGTQAWAKNGLADVKYFDAVKNGIDYMLKKCGAEDVVFSQNLGDCSSPGLPASVALVHTDSGRQG